jgi:TonB-linked SusC/RagA family outer membrane protein
MRLTLFLVLLNVFGVYARDSFSQNTRFNLDYKNTSIKQILEDVKHQGNLEFFFSNDDFDTNVKVDISVRNGTLKEVLDKIILSANLQYRLVDNMVIFSNAKSSETALQQQDRVKGRVTDGEQKPMPGVTITVVGTTRGVITDNDGNYTIDVNPTDKLVFSFIGMESQIVDVGNQKVINVQMKEKSQELEGVTVTAFGQQQTRREVVGSVTSVRPAELKVPSSNLTTALAGRLSGVIAYQRSGEPGQDYAEFFIRGVNTFGYKVDPLILIDNLEVSKEDFARLTTEDIASFSIMKDAAATALYGARGANGVILVTTKQGAEGKAKISFRVENAVSMPTKNVDLADPITYMKLHNEAVATRNPLLPRPYSQDKIANTIPGSNSVIYPNTDWRDKLLKPYAMNQKGYLSISGGGKVASYYVAGSFTNENGNLKVDGNNNFNNNIDLKTYQLRSNTNIHVTPATEIIVRLSGVFDDYTGPINGGTKVYRDIMRTNPVLFPPVYPVDEEHAYVQHPMFGNYEDGNYLNPYAEMVKGYKDYSRSSMTATFELKQNLDFLAKGLSLSAMGSTNRYAYFDISRYYNPFWYRLVEGSVNRKTGEYSVEVINPTGGSEYLGYSEGPKEVSSIFHFQSILNYDHTFKDKHRIGGMLVFLVRNELEGNAGSLQLSLPHRNIGLSGRATYSFGNRYFAEFNFGYNGSERFYKTERFGFFPSFGLAWSVSDEKFWSANFPVSKLKLRATYGLVGNDQIGSASDRFFYLSNVNMNDANRNAAFGEEYGYSRNGISVTRYENKDITWETSRKLDLGVDIGLLENKIEIIADYFSEYRSNILMTRVNIPTTMGLSAQSRANVGEASSYGVDVSVDVNHYFNPHFWLTGRGNFTYATSQYEVYEEPVYPNSYSSHVGYSLTQEWGYIAERLFIDDAEVNNSPRQSFGTRSAMAGDIKYKDVNKDGQITTLDRVPIGYPTTPEIVYGFGFSAGYKSFDLSAFFQGSARSSFWINPVATAPFISYTYSGENFPAGTVLQNQLLKAYADDHWSEENRNLYALWPRLDDQTNSNNSQTNTWFMRDGAFLRLKQIEIGYTLPKDFVNKVRIQSLRIYANGTNLVTWSAFKLWDIEQAGRGLDYPIQKVYNLGIQLSL